MSVDKTRIIIKLESGIKPMVYFLDSEGKRLNEGYLSVSLGTAVSELITMLNEAKKQAWSRRMNKAQGELGI
ncbi:hypothetical protein [Campylobacter sp. 19-13652]|uniref:hypothetical protein n=1 Tax=Campylobacter sp. 19-13652 TaxID=2840180 RepID=UPI001C773C40|nr:hypothetical protein [Campylobacter sp. 19-13652]BCX79263.1 hypothetical protein LBC_07250 [Campylobacter sp. 19-13652]